MNAMKDYPLMKEKVELADIFYVNDGVLISALEHYANAAKADNGAP